MRDPMETSENQYLNEQYGDDEIGEATTHEGATVDKNEIVCARCGMELEEGAGANDVGCGGCEW